MVGVVVTAVGVGCAIGRLLRATSAERADREGRLAANIAAVLPARSRTRFGGLKITAAPPTMSCPWNASVPPMSWIGSDAAATEIARQITGNCHAQAQRPKASLRFIMLLCAFAPLREKTPSWPPLSMSQTQPRSSLYVNRNPPDYAPQRLQCRLL